MKFDELFLAKTRVLYKIKPEVSGLKYPASIIRPPASVRYKKVLKKFLSKRRKIFVKSQKPIHVLELFRRKVALRVNQFFRKSTAKKKIRKRS